MVLHAKSMRNNLLVGGKGPSGLYSVVVLTWALEAIASRRVLGEKSLSFTFELLETLESLDSQGVSERDREVWDNEGVGVLSSNLKSSI
jgi:hypothetical protein